ncbi:MAG: hypothetical protein BLM47_01730 [Candidatus Reconcilbacillus cellulovorans]|uniref:Pseudouridine synthase n=1 Tax=Candidatus Reconcilbacillus cellulovorans TaxID=1906605 RepID=A0A2A6E3D9_9BACL|nr:MAG: hypothetical protein BLM47_01730 [Candidatus Reconcilbacillus cellulovorans]
MTEATQYYAPLRYVVTADEDGWPVRAVLRRRLRCSRRLLVRLKRTELGITVNGVRRRVDEPVRAGDVVEIRMAVETSERIRPEPMALNILYEDDHLLVVDKPPGMLVHPTLGQHSGTLANAVIHHWAQHGEICRFRPAHRLDRDTSGIVVIAKNAYAHRALSEQLANRQVRKRYIALVQGKWPHGEIVIEAPIGPDPDDPRKRKVTPDGSPSITRVLLVRNFAEDFALVEAFPETGRTHQIRVHLFHAGCPIAGDPLYGEQTGLIARTALHAAQIEFIHPATGAPISFSAPLPDDMEQAIRRLGEANGKGREAHDAEKNELKP